MGVCFLSKLNSRKLKFLVSLIISIIVLLFGGVARMFLFLFLFLAFICGRLYQNFVIQYKDYKEMNRLGILTYRLKDNERTQKLISELQSQIEAYKQALDDKGVQSND